jgi:hypothetical protein
MRAGVKVWLNAPLGRLSWAIVPLALLGYGLYLALGISSPAVNGPAAFGLDDAVWVLGQVAFAIVGAVVASNDLNCPSAGCTAAPGCSGCSRASLALLFMH